MATPFSGDHLHNSSSKIRQLIPISRFPRRVNQTTTRTGRSDKIECLKCKKMLEIRNSSYVWWERKVYLFLGHTEWHKHNWQQYGKLALRLTTFRFTRITKTKDSRNRHKYRVDPHPSLLAWEIAISPAFTEVLQNFLTCPVGIASMSLSWPVAHRFSISDTHLTEWHLLGHTSISSNWHLLWFALLQQESNKDGYRFERMEISERLTLLKESGACFACLCIGHRTMDCKKARICKIDDCIRYRHPLLYECEPNTPNITVMTGQAASARVALGMVKVKVQSETGKETKANLLLD